MKKFNKVITVEVSVDSIAERLLEAFSPEYPHREMLTETLIGTALENDTLGLIYTNLNGFDNDVDFEVGQLVVCSEEIHAYRPNVDGDSYVRSYAPLGECAIVNINKYAKNRKVQVIYDEFSSNGEKRPITKWVDHKTLTLSVNEGIDLTKKKYAVEKALPSID